MACLCCNRPNCGVCNTFKRPLPHVNPCYPSAISDSCAAGSAKGGAAAPDEDVPCTCEDATAKRCNAREFVDLGVPSEYAACWCARRSSQCDRTNCNSEFDEFGNLVCHKYATITKVRTWVYFFDNVACQWRRLLEGPMFTSQPITGGAGDCAAPGIPDCTPPDCDAAFPAIDCTCVNPLP
jgi:hypothetical protein